jgi:D-threo-aldose 1-dehydrogenase
VSLAAEVRTALRRGPLALGGAPLGNLYAAVGDDAAVAVIRRAAERGVGYFDTAPHYGNGRSEVRFGQALRSVPRDRFLLSTKVGRLLAPAADAARDQHGYVDVLPFVQRYDYSYDGTLRSLDESLRRLDLARVDIAFIHDIDVATHGAAQPQRFREAMEGALPALARHKVDGTLAGFGLGVNDVDVCLDTLAVADIDAILLAGRYTLADQSALPSLLPECVRRDVAIVAGGVFNSGILATGTSPRGGGMPFFVGVLRPYVDHVIDCFGPYRTLWGSDWPVVELGGGYARWRAATQALLACLGDDERAAVLGGNARRFYGLDD